MKVRQKETKHMAKTGSGNGFLGTRNVPNSVGGKPGTRSTGAIQQQGYADGYLNEAGGGNPGDPAIGMAGGGNPVGGATKK